ncbi:uncharacterized protein LOC128852915 [Cuculus canorus]|uniref:uncharacterized protein LOC128852915 n=1 Tax=Cuculus canorus TaxID=55661 RepID=UPI0023AAB6DA|nr:uncharacterized protein LOC128852915 [Cuculus canorus]
MSPNQESRGCGDEFKAKSAPVCCLHAKKVITCQKGLVDTGGDAGKGRRMHGGEKSRNCGPEVSVGVHDSNIHGAGTRSLPMQGAMMLWNHSGHQMLAERPQGRSAASQRLMAELLSPLCEGSAPGKVVGDAKEKAPVETALKKTTKVEAPGRQTLEEPHGGASSCLWRSHIPRHIPPPTSARAKAMTQGGHGGIIPAPTASLHCMNHPSSMVPLLSCVRPSPAPLWPVVGCTMEARGWH